MMITRSERSINGFPQLRTTPVMPHTKPRAYRHSTSDVLVENINVINFVRFARILYHAELTAAERTRKV